MPECPSCHQDVTYSILDNWFACPFCNRWLSMRTNELGSNWLEPGQFKDGHIHPVRIPRTPHQDQSSETEGTARILQTVTAQPISSGSRKGWVFWFSAILIGAAFFVFTNIINLNLDPIAKLIAAGIAVGSALILYFAVEIAG